MDSEIDMRLSWGTVAVTSLVLVGVSSSSDDGESLAELMVNAKTFHWRL